MSSNINKKKISLFTNQNFLKYIFIAILSCLFLVYIYYEFIKRDKIYNVIQNISEKYNYQLKNIEINSLQRINKSEINNIISHIIFEILMRKSNPFPINLLACHTRPLILCVIYLYIKFMYFFA